MDNVASSIFLINVLSPEAHKYKMKPSIDPYSWQNVDSTLKGTYHAKCTFVLLLYMNMCPRCSRELTKCQKTQPSLFSSIPKSLKKGLQRIWSKLIQIWTLLWRHRSGATAIGPTLHLSGECGVGPRPAIAARKRWRCCSTYARPVSGVVVCHKSSEEDFPAIVTMVTLLFILRCGFFSPSPRQAFAPTALIQCNPSPSRQAL